MPWLPERRSTLTHDGAARDAAAAAVVVAAADAIQYSELWRFARAEQSTGKHQGRAVISTS